MKYQKRIALCAIICAMNVLVLILGAIVDVLDLTACAITALFVAVIAVEIGGYYPWLVYGVTGVLSFFLLPSKFPAVLFALIGCYPILKLYFEKLPRIVAWLLKLVYLNAMLSLMIAATRFILMAPDSKIAFSVPVYLIGNVAFVLFDFCLSQLMKVYFSYFRRRFGISRLFK